MSSADYSRWWSDQLVGMYERRGDPTPRIAAQLHLGYERASAEGSVYNVAALFRNRERARAYGADPNQCTTYDQLTKAARVKVWTSGRA
jgi:hypothetical protein